MGLIFDTMGAFLREDDWGISRIGESLGYSMTVKGENGQWTCIAQAEEEARFFLFYSVSPIEVPLDKRAAMAEFTAYANFNTLVGNFELGLDTGDLRYKTSLSLKEIPDAALEAHDLLTTLIKQLIHINVFMMDQYLPGILAVCNNGVAPKDAIAKIEDS
ncbi:MAG TPA: YbjN domain-containing protein [Chloroflexota bacterium]|nr:YbjN domain-containing protein [Chloroflexota bacterium]